MEVFGSLGPEPRSLGAKIGADGRVIGVFQFVDFAIIEENQGYRTLQADSGGTGRKLGGILEFLGYFDDLPALGEGYRKIPVVIQYPGDGGNRTSRPHRQCL